MQKWLMLLKKDRDRLILKVFFDSGMRISELRFLKIDDIDFLDKKILVKKGKGDKARIIPVSS